MPALNQFNWVDWITIFILIFAIIEGWRLGFIHLLASFLAYSLTAFIIAKYYTSFNQAFINTTGIISPWTGIICIFILALFVQVVITEIIIKFSGKIAAKIMATWIDNLFGSLLSFINAVIIMAIVESAILTVQFIPSVSQDISRSVIARQFNNLMSKYRITIHLPLDIENSIQNSQVLIDDGKDTMTKLNISLQRWNLIEDTSTERQIESQINAERQKNGLNLLLIDETLKSVASQHSFNMFEGKYFSNIDLNNHNLKSRLDSALIRSHIEAENLALTTDLASLHSLFMNSPIHKSNILNPNFTRLGVGIIDGGDVGEMVTEIFTD
jgi:uncharacterized protein YkwD